MKVSEKGIEFFPGDRVYHFSQDPNLTSFCSDGTDPVFMTTCRWPLGLTNLIPKIQSRLTLLVLGNTFVPYGNYDTDSQIGMTQLSDYWRIYYLSVPPYILADLFEINQTAQYRYGRTDRTIDLLNQFVYRLQDR